MGLFRKQRSQSTEAQGQAGSLNLRSWGGKHGNEPKASQNEPSSPFGLVPNNPVIPKVGTAATEGLFLWALNSKPLTLMTTSQSLPSSLSSFEDLTGHRTHLPLHVRLVETVWRPPAFLHLHGTLGSAERAALLRCQGGLMRPL